MTEIQKDSSGAISLGLPTEMRNAKSMQLHLMTPEELLKLLIEEEAFAVSEASKQNRNLAKLVRQGIETLSQGRSIHYFGAGTSGRIATQDAAELYPTFNCGPTDVVAHMAGGPSALLTSVENAEDDTEAGALDAAAINPGDLAIGLAASGRTPYVGGALVKARSLGASTALIACVPHPALGEFADITIAGDTGPEVLTGSTRLKAGTFQKVVLSGFSTAVMVGLGKTYSNLMVSMVATNEKLHSRSIRMLMDGSGASEYEAIRLLTLSEGDLKLALLSAIANVSPADAAPQLAVSGGIVQHALEALQKHN
jgi:N-acetylmuramic acid 6-phosphate etherase